MLKVKDLRQVNTQPSNLEYTQMVSLKLSLSSQES
jgi:hypothetical protein